MLRMIRYLLFYQANQCPITRLGLSIGPQHSKTSVRKQNTAKTSGRLSRVGPTFDQLLAKYMKNVVPHNPPIKSTKSKRWSPRKQRPTKTVQKVAQPRSSSHPSPGLAWCFSFYPSPMCCPTHVLVVRRRIHITGQICLLIWAGGTTSFCLLTGWSDRHGRRECSSKRPMWIKVLSSIYIIWSQEPMTCIELSPYFGNKITREVNCFLSFHLCFWFVKLHQKTTGICWAPKVADGSALGPGQSVCPAIRLTRVIILISCVVIHLITWELLAIS
jgi:hypothetical protein